MINNNPRVLVISNTHDYSTDHITFNLKNANIPYLRLDRDRFSLMDIKLFPVEREIYGNSNNINFKISPKKLRSIYFRGPIYLRDIYKTELTPDEQFSRSQWAAFIRSLVIFENILWVNHPQATYKAEIKPYQLYIAKKIGFKVPNTIVTNSNEIHNHPKLNKSDKKYIIKTLDPVILKIKKHEAFIYTNIINAKELRSLNISNAPIILQEALIPKIDIRVTVVDDTIYAVSIKKDGKGIDKDWRTEKNNLKFEETALPLKINNICIELIRQLGLKFGAIDLIYYDNNYYFLEINPTGEWAWLLEHTKMDIDKKITNLLIKGIK